MCVSEAEFTVQKEVAHLTLIPHFTGSFNKKFTIFSNIVKEQMKKRLQLPLIFFKKEKQGWISTAGDCQDKLGQK